MIRCKIYSCRRYPYQPCCEGCRDAATCPDCCKNHPSRCKCAFTGPLPSRRRRVDRAEVVRLADTGMTHPLIAAEVGCSVPYVDRIIREHRQKGGDRHG